MLLVKPVLKVEAKAYYFVTREANVKQMESFIIWFLHLEINTVIWNTKRKSE